MPTEHMTIEEVESNFGFLDELRPTVQREKHFRWPFGPPTQKKFYEFPAGSTEDGIERQKLITDAIINKKDRISVQDLAESWLRNIRNEMFGYALHWSDKPFFDMLKAGLHPAYLGLFSLWPEIVSLARSCHPIGIINAGDPRQAAEDVFSIGGIYHQYHGSGIQTAAGTAAGIAEAFNPDATFNSVTDALLSVLPDTVRAEFEEVLELTATTSDMQELRAGLNDRFIRLYGDRKSSGEEVVSRGLAIFVKTKGNVKDSILWGANFGRDTDCTAAIAGGLSGALSGAEGIPQEWIEKIDEATEKNNRITVCSRTLAETARGLHNSILNSLDRKRKQFEAVLSQSKSD
jgi:ADP-ribosylglycohydrolase